MRIRVERSRTRRPRTRYEASLDDVIAWLAHAKRLANERDRAPSTNGETPVVTER